jgi:predicted nucleic acid-binding protein
MIVCDASVILKWIFDEEAGSDHAGRLKDGHVEGSEIIAVPDLLFYEVANVLATKTRLDDTAVHEAFSLLWHFQLERFDFGLEEFLAGLSLSRKYKITLYDAAYIELARRLKCAFVTADKKLYEKIKSIKSVGLL